MFNELKKDKKLTSETNQEVLYFLNVTDWEGMYSIKPQKGNREICILRIMCYLVSLEYLELP
jgi:hypothetical protein